MINKSLTWLSFSLFLLGQATCTLPSLRAAGLDLANNPVVANNDYTSLDSKDSKGGGGEGGFERQRFYLTLDTRFGYDDNTLGQSDSAHLRNAAGRIVSVDVDTSDSAFFNFSLGAGYTAQTERLSITAGADVGTTYYFDRPGRDYDVNGGLSARISYKLTPRAFLQASSYNAYESQGDYGASNLTNFNGQFGGAGRTAGTTAALDGDYFYTTDLLSLTYQFAPRLSVVTSNSLVAFAYDNSFYANIQDRIEDYTSLELQYLVLPNLSLAGNYRFGYVDYFGVNNDSQSHFVLAGFDYSASQRLHASVRAGVEFREYIDTAGDETSPYAEANVTYSLSRNSSVALSTRYGIEEGDLSIDNTVADTFRVGLDYNQNITSRINVYVGLYYTHTFYETPLTHDAGSFTEDTYDVSAGVRYSINRHMSAEIGYTHTSFDSGLEDRSYDRNRYFGGLRLSF